MLLLASSALALPLLVERFDSPELPAGWKTGIAVQTGGGKPSAATVEDGALVLRAEPKTKKFTAATRKLELREVEWIKVDGRVRTEGVAADTTGPCGVVVRFEGGAFTQAGPCAAADWTAFTRYFAVPKGARDVEVGFLLPAAGTARLDELLVEPASPPWRSVGRGGFTYHWLGDSAFREDLLVANDETLDRAAALIGAPPAGKIDYWQYGSLDTIEQYTGVRADGHVDGATIHTIYRTDPQRIMRVVARAWGSPPPLLAEGLAVSFAGEWGGRDLRQSARALGDKAPTLEALLDPKTFRALPPEAAYPVAGAFAQWVTATRGPDTLKALYGQLKADAPVADNRKALEAGLGMPLAEADTALRAWW
ncbi:MAG: hypothetical protein ACK4YP_26165 [Myxococcota bacterium]